MMMLNPRDWHLIRRANKTPVDKDWPKLSGQQYNDHRALHGDVGLVCGDIMVLDIDVDKATGEIRPDTIVALMALDLQPTLKVQTPSGGWHYFFQNDKQQILPRRIGVAPGIDWLGNGGYVALYEPLSQYDPDAMNGIPASIIELLSKPKATASTDLAIKEGNRNDSLYRYGCGLAGQNKTRDEVWQGMSLENNGYLPPLDLSEFKLIFSQVEKFIKTPDAVPTPLFHSIADIEAMDLPAIEQICGPLHSAGVTMIAGTAGVGKSLFALNMAAHIAAGMDLEIWKVPKPRRVLYIDGEMAPQYLQGRAKSILRSDILKFMHLGLMNEQEFYINLTRPEHRQFFLAPNVFDQFDVFIFDTVSSLIQGSESVDIFSPTYWLQMEPFHQKFRAVGKTVVWVDNLNKKGEVFGTSAKHHKVDSMWHCEPFTKAHHDATVAFVLSQNKMRGDNEAASGVWEYYRNGGWRIR